MHKAPSEDLHRFSVFNVGNILSKAGDVRTTTVSSWCKHLCPGSTVTYSHKNLSGVVGGDLPKKAQ